MTVTDQIVEKAREVAKRYSYDHLPAPLIKLMLESIAQDPVPDGWQPIATAPKIEFARYIGFDRITAALNPDDPNAGVCLITWLESDEDYEPGWQVQPFSEGLDCVESETDITHWMLLPPPPTSQGNGGADE